MHQRCHTSNRYVSRWGSENMEGMSKQRVGDEIQSVPRATIHASTTVLLDGRLGINRARRSSCSRNFRFATNTTIKRFERPGTFTVETSEWELLCGKRELSGDIVIGVG